MVEIDLGNAKKEKDERLARDAVVERRVATLEAMAATSGSAPRPPTPLAPVSVHTRSISSSTGDSRTPSYAQSH